MRKRGQRRDRRVPAQGVVQSGRVVARPHAVGRAEDEGRGGDEGGVRGRGRGE